MRGALPWECPRGPASPGTQPRDRARLGLAGPAHSPRLSRLGLTVRWERVAGARPHRPLFLSRGLMCLVWETGMRASHTLVSD